MKPDITPDTKVGALLEGWPELEETLVGLSPEFRRLKHPVLRRTVARVASLRQVAQVGGIPLGQLLATLRTAAGLEQVAVSADAQSASPRPGWATAAARTVDARPIIDGGGQPLESVMRALAQLGPGDVLELLTPFAPAPLLDLARQQGFETWTGRTEREGPVRTWFRREEGA